MNNINKGTREIKIFKINSLSEKDPVLKAELQKQAQEEFEQSKKFIQKPPNEILHHLRTIQFAFLWELEMEHIFLQTPSAARILHNNCTYPKKNSDITVWIKEKDSKASLHETWSFISFEAVVRAITCLIHAENGEFISFCRFLCN